MLVFGGALAWLGWRLLEQDRSLERQQVQERLDLAADHMANELQRSLLELESYLSFTPSPTAKAPPEGVVVLLATGQTVDVYPPGGLLFYPAITAGTEPPAAIFVEGEALEYQRNDPVRAIDVFRALACSPNPAVRAGALLRLGRNLRKTGHPEEALQAYGELAQLGPIQILELPSELVAIEARCSVLEAMGKHEELRKEALLMDSALRSGRWRLLRPAWEFHVEEARRWAGESLLTEREQNALVLSSAAEWVHDRWLAEPESKGRRFQKIEGRPALILWSATQGRLASVLAGPACLGAMWKEALRGQHVQGALVDADGQLIIGSFDRHSQQAVRAATASRPWTLHVTSADPGADLAGFAGRRHLLLSGFVVLGLVLLAGSYFIMRSIHREHAVARLQSEFVSAVSHEFRTPLTSLRQLSEMLSKGRVPTEELRQQSYDILASESERLQRLVESLLDFGRIEAHAFHYHYQSLDSGALVHDVVAEFQERVAAQGFRVELRLAHPCRSRSARLGAREPARQCRQVFAGLPHHLGRDSAGAGPPGGPGAGPGDGHPGLGAQGDLQEFRPGLHLQVFQHKRHGHRPGRGAPYHRSA
jgi:hypothetical protein